MGEILMKILGFIIVAGTILGLIGFIVMLIQFAWAVANGKASFFCPWMPWLGGGCYTIKGKINIYGKDEVPQEASADYDPMNQPLRVAPHSKPKMPKKKKPKPEWWRFLTEESIGSLLKKRRQRKNRSRGSQKRSVARYAINVFTND